MSTEKGDPMNLFNIKYKEKMKSCYDPDEYRQCKNFGSKEFLCSICTEHLKKDTSIDVSKE